MRRDVLFALRYLGRRPGFTTVAVLTLALGIGANTAIFSVLQVVLLEPLGYLEPDRLVKIVAFDRREGERSNLSPADFMDLERDNTVFARTGAHGWVGSFTIAGGGEAERVGGVNVTEGFFPTLGVAPRLGRLFTAEEDRPGAAPTALLTEGLWRRRFGADPSVIGSAILVNAVPTTVVGVLPVSFRHLEPNPERQAEIFLPYRFETAEPNRGGHFIRAVARLRAGVSLSSAEAQLDAMGRRLERAFPTTNTGREFRIDPLHDAMVAESRPELLLLAGAVGLVLLVACVNLANLLLAKGTGRARELAVRGALGASRARIVRQLLCESLLLALGGAAFGLVLAQLATRVLTGLAAAGVPRADEIRIDATVLAFAVGAALVTAVLFGLLPALQLSRDRSADWLKQGVRGTSDTVAPGRTRDALVAAEVALALVLLVGAALLLRSFSALLAVPPGFTTEQVITFQTSVPTATYPEGTQIPFYTRLYERVQALPGVAAVGAINILPLSSNYDSRGIQIEDRPLPQGQLPSVQARSISPGYFRALDLPLRRGREFDGRDTETSPLVVVVSESMARRYWPGEDPIGKRITFNSGIPRDRQQEVGGPGSREVVGVVGDVKHLSLDERAVPMFYTPQAQAPSYHTMALVVRATGDAGGVVAGVRRELASMDPGVPVYQVRTGEALIASVTAQPRLRSQLVGLFAGLALVLALVGVYGVVNYLVAQRTQEFGVRVALGASPRDVVTVVVRQAIGPLAAGVAGGLAGAVTLSRLLRGMLFGVSPLDARAYVLATLLVAAGAALALVVPSLRATRVDPMIALRAE